MMTPTSSIRVVETRIDEKRRASRPTNPTQLPPRRRLAVEGSADWHEDEERFMRHVDRINQAAGSGGLSAVVIVAPPRAWADPQTSQKAQSKVVGELAMTFRHPAHDIETTRG
jgi:protein required for attachment to host cells